MKTISIITLGCDKNENDTENLSGLLRKKGFSIAKNPNNADAVIVHTCSFIEAARKESVTAILEVAQHKKDGQQLIVTGCMVQQHGKEMMQEIPEVDAFLGTGQLSQVIDLINHPKPRFLDRRDPGGLMDPDVKSIRATKGITATLRLSEGCSHPCSFCVIPKLRGGLQSRKEDVIINEAKKLSENGVKELIIIGQDTGDWGRDLFGEPKLDSLLKNIRDLNKFRWIRLMYLHPHSFTDGILKVLADSPEIFPYLDMPIQHIDNQVLSDMKRLHTESEVRSLIERIRTQLPKLSLRSTLIVGFPGETEAQFDNLCSFVEEGHFNHLGAFTYSPEDSTPAALLKNQLADNVKKERLHAITDIQYRVSEKKAKGRLGQVETVLLERSEKENVLGRTRMEAPEIDSIIRLPKIAARRGKFIQAKLTGFDAYEYQAEPLS